VSRIRGWTAALGSLGLLAAVGPGGIGAAAARPPPAPPDCRAVEPGADLQAALDAAPRGAALCLAPGDHAGPVRLGRGIRLSGPRSAVIRSQGEGSTVLLEGEGTALVGVTVDGSGGRFDLLDAAVRIHADRARVEGVKVVNALFGLLAEQCRGIELRGNEVVGAPEKALGMRGDAIRIWEVRESRIADNRVRHGRDVVVWYSPGNHIVGNRVEDGRYGTHLMYSHGNVIERNVYRRNVVGVFSMYSRDLEIRHNILAESTGAAGVGLGAKESSSLTVLENQVVGNTTGVWLDTSPLDPADTNVFRRNAFRFSEAGVVFHGRVDGNVFEANRFGDNHAPVRVDGRGDAQAARWRRNYWDDYAGYDLDGDGTGDVPYELRSLEGDLLGRVPALAFFRGSPAMTLVELVGRVVPLFEAQELLVDPEPAMRPPPRARVPTWTEASGSAG